MPRYADSVERYFALPPRLPGTLAAGEAGSVAAGTWVQFGFDLEDGKIRNPGFRAFACPHIIAACQRVAELLDGATVEAIAALQPDEIRQEFEIPVEKTGKLLILMDALSACREQAVTASG